MLKDKKKKTNKKLMMLGMPLNCQKFATLILVVLVLFVRLITLIEQDNSASKVVMITSEQLNGLLLKEPPLKL